MVRCADCGLLALREHYTMRLVEAPLLYRETGKVPLTTTKPQMELTERVPVCYENLRRFEIELEEENLKAHRPSLGNSWNIDPTNIQPEAARKVFDKEIGCESFIKHRPGATPQEHREMLDRQWKIKQEILVREAVWAREDARDARVDAREDARDKREDDRDAAVEKRHRTELWVLGWVIAGATLLASIVGATATCRSTNTVVIHEQVVPTAAPQSTR